VKIESRLDQATHIHLIKTNVTMVPQPNLTNAKVYFYIRQIHGSVSINATFNSYNFGGNNKRCYVKLDRKSLSYFNQSQLFEMNGSYSKDIDLSSNRFQELPKINQLDVRVLLLCFNRIKKLIDSTNLPTSIEVKRRHIYYHIRFLI
jgi:hypothetical protein